jgi:hypothetical protein
MSVLGIITATTAVSYMDPAALAVLVIVLLIAAVTIGMIFGGIAVRTSSPFLAIVCFWFICIIGALLIGVYVYETVKHP